MSLISQKECVAELDALEKAKADHLIESAALVEALPFKSILERAYFWEHRDICNRWPLLFQHIEWSVDK